ncbi:MAG: EF-hand domain-containing protein [Candidatus Pacebacteria bacterium]|nr:EF-hand domain-containing protein [Candidatus Paceibacterota bacterium]
MDDDNSKSLSLPEFKKVVKDYRLKINEKEAEKLFGVFDRNHSGSIDYDEFVRAIIVRLTIANLPG